MELRILRSGVRNADGVRHITDTLQFREKIYRRNDDGTGFGDAWSDWQDVPIVEKVSACPK